MYPVKRIESGWGMQAMEVVWGRCCVVVKGHYAGDDNGHYSGIYPSNELL